jgi:cbb3-type cytochrome oxidase cytochrome c subunit
MDMIDNRVKVSYYTEQWHEVKLVVPRNDVPKIKATHKTVCTDATEE